MSQYRHPTRRLTLAEHMLRGQRYEAMFAARNAHPDDRLFYVALARWAHECIRANRAVQEEQT